MTDIVKILDYYGVYVRSSAGYVKISCPWHTDSTPSASVRDNRLHCFSCGWDGDAIDVVKEKEGCGYADALRLCEEITGESSNPLPGGTAQGDSLFGSSGNLRSNRGAVASWRSGLA